MIYFRGVKKFITGIIAFVYLALSMGVIVNYHYCRDKLSSVKIKVVDNDGCGCGSKKKMKCCHDEIKILKIADKQQLVNNYYKVNQPEAVLSFPPVTDKAIAEATAYIALQYHSPPEPLANKVYLHNCVFRL